MTSRFSDQKVLITGAASGIGAALSRLFDKAGATVLAVDVDAVGLDKLAASCSPSLQSYPCDLLDKQDTAQTLNSIQERNGPISVLINNAGITSGHFIDELSEEQISKTFRINVLSHFQTTQAVLPGMIEAGNGHIVTIASAGGIVGSPRMADYISSKFAAVGLDEALRLEFRRKKWNIHTTLVAPFYIRTGMFDGVQTRFSWLLPIMKTDYVALRIFKAIARKKKRLIMPRFVYLAFPLRLLPPVVFDFLVDFFGITRSMDHFTGRKSESQ